MKQLCIAFIFAILMSSVTKSWVPLVAFFLLCILGACVAAIVALRRFKSGTVYVIQNNTKLFVPEHRFNEQNKELN